MERKDAAVSAGLIVGGLVLFGASLNDPFHFDDALIVADSNVTNPGRWAHFLNPLHLRQVTFLTFYLNHLVGGVDPVGYHAVNIGLHLANSVLLYWLLRRFAKPWVATAAACLFLAHPIQTEPVLYVYQRSTLLGCFFSLLAVAAVARRQRAWAALLFFLAFESKESALAVPLALIVWSMRRDWKDVAAASLGSPPPSDGNRRGWRTWTQAYPLLLAIGVVWLATAALLLLAKDTTVGFSADVSPMRYLATQLRVTYTYFRLLVFPYPQSIEYDFQDAGGWVVFVAGMGIVLILGAAWRFRLYTVLAFFILLAPTSSIIPSVDAAFEHRLYLPMMAFSLLAAISLSRIPRRTLVTASFLVVLAVLTVLRGKTWSSETALWEDAAQRAPQKARVWFNLGGARVAQSPEEARAAFLRALELQPHYPAAYYNLGLIEQQKMKWKGAIGYYEKALMQDPAYWPATNNMANTLVALEEPARALEFFEKTLHLNPDYWPAQYNVAIVHFKSGRYPEAAARLRTVLDWRPDFREARQLLADALSRSGDRRGAEDQLKRLGITAP